MTLSRSTVVASLSLMLAMLPAQSRANFWTENGCTLDKPAPVFKNGGFKLDEATGKANESLKLGDSVILRLEHTQCGYLSRTYTFILKEAPSDTDIVGWEYRKAVELLALLEARSSPKLKLADERKALKAYTDLVSHPKTDVEINVKAPHDQFYELISVAAQVGQRDTRIVVKIWSGPY